MWGLVLALASLAPFSFGVNVEHHAKYLPKIAVNCGKVPFYVDLKSGEWIVDNIGEPLCDVQSKDDVLAYCKKVYPDLKVVNIVEMSEHVNFDNWCESGYTECTGKREVVPYRCLVDRDESARVEGSTRLSFWTRSR